jgi:predicted GIY-YIG superfamily endonuclease
MPEPERTALYRLYDAAGDLLYIGIAKDPASRWKSHANHPRTSGWWPLVSRKEVEWLPSREAADVAETEAIKKERPAHNRAKVDRICFARFRYRSPEIRWTKAPQDPWSSQAARIIKAEIAEGKIKPGDRMPTAKELHRRFGISDQTCGKMLRALADEGLLRQERRGGPYFCS